MRNVTTTQRPNGRSAVRAVEAGERARTDALRWLASQLGWERTLERLRCEEGEQSAQAA
jgi:hypothetical protein